MFKEIDIEYLQALYENIFEESVDNSKEFHTFVTEINPHPLRIKVEDWIREADRSILEEEMDTNINQLRRRTFLARFVSATELDAFITKYIETNITE